jgi:hypothetical protein
MEIFVDLLMRWLHLFTAVVMVGGVVGGAYLGQPIVAALNRNIVIGGIAALLVSGVNTMIRVMATAPKGWHMWFGIKFLLALHVFAMLFLLTKSDAPADKRKRWQYSAMITTGAVIAVGAYLRWLRGA